MSDAGEPKRGVECPPVQGSTYWCFTPDSLDRALDDWSCDPDPAVAATARQRVREFLYAAGLLRSGMRKETKRENNPVLQANGE